MRKPTAEELSNWEQLLAQEGMPKEPPADAVKEILLDGEEKKGERTPLPENAIQRLQEYWATRTGRQADWEAHRQAMTDIAIELGLESTLVDEDTMKEIEEEVAGVELRAQELCEEMVSEESRRVPHPKRLINVLKGLLRDEFPNMSREALRAISERFVNRVFGE